ncbi:hypothetical protein ACOMHN_051005 [Nucella lapillus]
MGCRSRQTAICHVASDGGHLHFEQTSPQVLSSTRSVAVDPWALAQQGGIYCGLCLLSIDVQWSVPMSIDVSVQWSVPLSIDVQWSVPFEH